MDMQYVRHDTHKSNSQAQPYAEGFAYGFTTHIRHSYAQGLAHGIT